MKIVSFCFLLLTFSALNIFSQQAQIENLKASKITNSGLNIHFSTPEKCQAFIKYGFTEKVEKGIIYSNDSLFHNFEINGAKPSQLIFSKFFIQKGGTLDSSTVHTFITKSLSSGEMKAYFNRSVNTDYATTNNTNFLHQSIDDTLIAFIDRATESIDIAIYNFNNSSNLSSISAALNQAHNNGVDIRIIYNQDTNNGAISSLNSNIPKLESPVPVFPNGHGIMHNKFMIIDGKSNDPNKAVIWTGSTNWTVGNINTDPNNVIVIQDKSLALAYILEFEEMWGSNGLQPNLNNSKFGFEKTDNTPHFFNINGSDVELYFSPSDGTNAKIIEAINGANEDIIFNTMLINRNDIGSALLFKHFNNTLVGGMIDHPANSTQYNSLYDGLDGRITTHLQAGQLHHKTLICDALGANKNNAYVLTGSHNWSTSAENRNDENTLIIYNADIANQYLQEAMKRVEESSTPTAVNDIKSTYYEFGMTMNVLENDIVPNEAILSVEIIQNPNNGTTIVNSDNTVLYTPNNGFSGNDVFSYRVCNNNLDAWCDAASVSVSVGTVSNELEELSIKEIYLYPNPIRKGENLHFSDFEEIESINIYDFQGKEVYTSKNIISDNLSTSFLNSGFYIVKFSSREGKSELKKLIIE